MPHGSSSQTRFRAIPSSASLISVVLEQDSFLISSKGFQRPVAMNSKKINTQNVRKPPTQTQTQGSSITGVTRMPTMQNVLKPPTQTQTQGGSINGGTEMPKMQRAVSRANTPQAQTSNTSSGTPIPTPGKPFSKRS